MFKSLLNWVDNRTGYRALLDEALHEPIPGGAKWRYVFGSALSATFVIQVVTGLFLMCSYSPSGITAWGSVFFIDQVMTLGWLVRGIHHFGSQAMVVLLVLHLLQVLIAGAYRAPREANWWFGLILMFLTLGLSLTGYLLPWDQKGYWATKVATNIMAATPLVGPAIQSVLIGGQDYGNQTLTRFYGLHVGILPLLLVLAMVVHIMLFRQHGVTHPKNTKGRMGYFWPEQLFLDTLFALLVLGVIIGLLLWEGGANLDAPADPASSDYPARPEWYFLFLFQMLKYFPGEMEVVGTIVVPTAIVVVLLLLPLFDKIMPTKLAHFLACSFVFAVAGAAIYLTYDAVVEDNQNPQFQASRQRADLARRRALELAGSPDNGVPPDGAQYLLLRDPLHHGQDVFKAKCMGCHTFGEEGKTGERVMKAANLKGFGSYAWVRGLLEKPDSPEYFGDLKQCGGMKRWKSSSKLSAKELDEVARFVASFAEIPDDVSAAEWANDPKVTEHPGLPLFVKECGQCHVVGESGLLTEGGTEEAPNLFGWGSRRWTARMIRKPGAPENYQFLEPEGLMPSFGTQLTNNDVETVVKYLQGDYLGGPAAGGSVIVKQE